MALTGSAGTGRYRKRIPARIRVATADQMEKMVIDGLRKCASSFQYGLLWFSWLCCFFGSNNFHYYFFYYALLVLPPVGRFFFFRFFFSDIQENRK
jgi:hypothetical protein